MARQQELTFRAWGGARAGSGRKPKGKWAGEKHGRRPTVDARVPLHLTMRVSGMPSLRTQRCMTAVRRALRGGREHDGFRLVHYAVQPDHLHLVVEAKGKRALSNGARALAIRMARWVNVAIGRKGRVFSDRYHATPLSSPRQVRRALAYVLLQQRRHAAKRRVGMTSAPDACSSASVFDGWTFGVPRAGPWDETTVAAKTWLLTTGWRRYGKIDPAEVPGRS
jgi:REP element-mobilizing transposase RayT